MALVEANPRISLRCLQCRVLFSLWAPYKEFLRPSQHRLAPASLRSPARGLRQRHRSPPRPRLPRRPAGLSLHPPRLLLLETLPSGYLSPNGSGTTKTRANAFPDHPRQIPSTAPVAGEEENPSYLALRVPQRQRRRLPVTPLPPASYRHRLPQQPANCSATTRPLIRWFHAPTTVPLIGSRMPAALPLCSI